MTRASSGRSRADVVSVSLRADILAGRLEPGRRLTFPELCPTYGVSVGVLREALVRLVDHGIVRAESNLGFSVMTLSDADLIGLTSVRAHIEPAFLHEAVEVGSMPWEGEVVAAHHLLERTPITESGSLSAAWTHRHAEFHLALSSGCGNRRMMEMVSRLRDEADLYRRWYLDGEQAGRDGARVTRDHRELLDAVLDRDAARAEALLREQIRATTDICLSASSPQRA